MTASVMRASPYLRGLEPQQLKLLAGAATRSTFPAGAKLETDDPPILYLVLSGEVAAWTPADPDGAAEIVGQEGPGAMFGSARLTGETEVPVYRAATPIEVCAWTQADLNAAFAQSGGLERALNVRLSRRAREDELLGLLRRTPLFQHVSQPLIRWLVKTSTLAPFDAGTRIFRKGNDGDAMLPRHRRRDRDRRRRRRGHARAGCTAVTSSARSRSCRARRACHPRPPSATPRSSS